MFNMRTIYMKVIFNISVFLSLLLVFLLTFTVLDNIKLKQYQRVNNIDMPKRRYIMHNSSKIIQLDDDYNIWLIFTKVIDKSPLFYNFKHLIKNLLNTSSVTLHMHIFADNNSQIIATMLLENSESGRKIKYTFYDVDKAANMITDIVEVMTPHFSSRPGTYYSDSLFYLSLGLYRIAPTQQKNAIMLDCDVYFKEDILNLFNEFQSFKKNTLFGLAPELTPVYRHVLYTYKLKHNTTLGEYYHDQKIFQENHPRGFQGYNSGVILLNLSAIRQSKEYLNVLSKAFVDTMVSKFKFKGHLGDQDFYTLLGYTRPNLFRTLHCGFNRQLCMWWRDHGYKDVFDYYFKCNHNITVLHGNCNTKIPRGGVLRL